MSRLFHAVTHGIRVSVRPVYAPAHSDPAEQRFVFIYRVRIENIGAQTATLEWRHWFIHDSAAGDSEVEGEGVIGQQPTLAPGDVHEYESYCVLAAPAGAMEGYYLFRQDDGGTLKVRIPRFELDLEA